MSIEKLINYLDNKEIIEEDKEEKLVDIEEWLNDEYYVGKINIYPFWKKVIIDFYRNNKNSIIFTGSTRSGKSFISYILILRKLYELSEWRKKYGSASLKFGLDKNSNISILILSALLETAERESISSLRRMVDSIDYFRDNLPRDDRVKSVLSFDNDRIQIRAVSSYVRSLLGSNMICVMLDEMNFIRGKMSGFKEALELYSEATSRIEQTFSIGDGKHYGFKILISSANTIDSFVESMIEKEKRNSNVLIVNAKRYEITPERFSDKKVYLFVGDKNFEPFFVDLEDKDKYRELLYYLNVDNVEEYLNYNNIEEVKIPEFYKDLFEYIPINFYNKSIDITKILRDVCGRSIGGVGNFFNNLGKFNACIDSNLESPFFQDSIVCSTENNVENVLIKNLKSNFYGERDKIYVLSIDLSKRYDATGLSMGYYDNVRNKVVVNMMLKILPPENKNYVIKYQDILDFIVYLIENRKFRIKYFVYDGYQTEFFTQFLGLNYKMETERIVVEGEKEYLMFKNAIYEESICYYRNDIFKEELFNLVYNINKRRVEHTEEVGKDLSDSICRLVYKILVEYSIINKSSVNIINVLKKMVDNKVENEKNDRDFIIEKENRYIGSNNNIKLIKKI